MFIVAYYTLIATIGLICNSLVLISVLKYKFLRKKQYTILVSLAVCDLLKVVVMINMIIYTLKENSENLCEKTSALGITLLFSSTFHLAAESINRCFMVNSPYRYLQALRKCYIVFVVALLWLLPAFIIIALPYALFGEDWKLYMYFEIDMFSCSNANIHEKKDIYVIIAHILFLAVPLTIMFVAYSWMLKTSYSNAKNIRAVSLVTPKQPTVTETTYSTPIISMVVMSYDTMSPSDYLRFPEIKQRPNSLASRASMEFKRIVKGRKLEIKASKTILLIIAAFIICNTPIFALTWYDHSNQYHSKTLSRRVFLGVAMWQVCIDPVVYFIRLKDFKRVRQTCTDFLIRHFRKSLRV